MILTLQTAQVLHASGVACIPCNADKRPRVPSWSEYRTSLPKIEELERWFSKDARIALIAGKVQCLDFDEKYSTGIFDRFTKRAEEVGLDKLLGQLILQQTPSGGYHLVWQCDGERIGNLKLAQKANLDSLIETRGDGGYFLISPSDGYKLIAGDWSSIPAINADDRDALLNLARTFDERPPVEAHEAAPVQPGGEATPGDDFDFRANLPEILKSHGWKPAGGKYWTRPGKARGISASWDVIPGRFFVFSSSTQFEPNHVYRPWHVYTVLECGGDYSRAAAELRRQGFGGEVPSKHTQQTQPVPADWFPPIEPSHEGIDPTGAVPTVETEDEKARRLFRARQFDPACKPPDLRVRFTLGGVVVSTPGNLTAITAQAKVGKSALIQGFVAASMTQSGDADCLGVIGKNTHGRGVIYLDTEQSRDDFWRAMDAAKRRAKIDAFPPWFQAFGIGDLPVAMQRRGLAVKMADTASAFGGMFAVFIDGVADMVLDVNDAEICNAFVAEIFELATRYDCPIVCVIHKNPGSDKTRGHLGSQLERKAETNLTLEKQDNETLVWSEKQRRAPIFKSEGVRFAWSEEAGMHVLVVGSGQPKLSQSLAEWRDFAITVLNAKQPLTYVELRDGLVKVSGRALPSAQRNIKQLRAAELITYDHLKGTYELPPLNPSQ
jgi:hypothetical protein